MSIRTLLVDDYKMLAGIITEKDILKLLSVLENDSATVEDFMTKEVVSFDQQEDLIAVCECLIKNHFRRCDESHHCSHHPAGIPKFCILNFNF